jgi:hypothetical protein
MATPGRSARNSSYQRTEAVSGNKTIADTETGELYLVSAASVITLPAAKAGAYFKFIMVDAVAGAHALKVVCAGTAKMKGAVPSIKKDNGSDSTVHLKDNAVSDGASATHVTVGAGAKDTYEGTWVECLCDGTDWIVTGLAAISHIDAAAKFA